MAGRPPFGCPIKVMVTAFMKMPAMSKKRTADALAGYVLPAVKPDADNLAKAALDACNGIIWRDDALICSLLVKKRYAAYPCLEIKVVPEETVTGSHRFGDDKQEFLSVLKNQLAGE